MEASKSDSARPPRISVLVIEDNRDFARLFGDMLEIMGCSLDVEFDVRSGLEAARKSAPDLIFCDLGLPGELDGFDFARLVRADPKLAHIPLIAVSGRTGQEDIQRAIDAGFTQIFPKPVKFADVSRALTTYSKDKRGSR